MNRDDIIRWARSAIRLSADDASLMGFDQEKTILDRYEFLCWFASNVATDVRKEEREACAKVCEKQIKSYMSKQYTTDPLGGFRERFAAEQCAAAIRARGEV